MDAHLRESPESNQEQKVEKYWKILAGFNWFVFLVVFVELILHWEGPGRFSSPALQDILDKSVRELGASPRFGLQA
jgi:hypothetical protein